MSFARIEPASVRCLLAAWQNGNEADNACRLSTMPLRIWGDVASLVTTLCNLVNDMPHATSLDHEHAGKPDTAGSMGIPPIEVIIDNFDLLDEWDDRYRYVIELGRGMDPLPDRHRSDANKVPGCASQVWLGTTVRFDDEQPRLDFCGDSDAHIVRGLVAILLAVVSGKPAHQILAADPIALFERLGLGEHLTPQRSNGFRSMVTRIRTDAQQALADRAALAR